jgi:hypothetical protein
MQVCLLYQTMEKLVAWVQSDSLVLITSMRYLLTQVHAGDA